MKRNDDSLRFENFEIPDEVDLLYREGNIVPLPPGAVRVLRYLASNPQRVVPKQELLENVWPDVFTTDGVLKKAIAQIRRALGDEVSSPRFVRTWHRRGYELIVPAVRTGLGVSDRREPDARPDSGRDSVPDYDQFEGRTTQMAELRAELASALNDSPTRPVVIMGEPGIGKTSLARHFREWAGNRGVDTFHARFLGRRGSSLDPYQIFVDLLATALGTSDPVTLPRRVADELGVQLPSELTGEASASAAATGDPARFSVSIAKAWLALARKRPMVIIFDDLQWADESSLETIGCLLRMLEDEPLMILMLVRNDSEGIVGKWLQTHALHRSYTTLTLAGLDRQSCRNIIGSVFRARRSGEIPQADIDRIFELTGGNPYFLMETLRKLVADGRIVRGPERWIWKGIEDLSLPGSVVTASLARLTNLSEETRRLIDQASIIGDEFSLSTLSSLSGKTEQDVEKRLAGAVRHDVLTAQDVSRESDYRFHHSILRHVAHQAIPPGKRRLLHRAVAQLLEAEHDADRVADVLAEHYSAAGDDRPAFDYALRAWRSAAKRSAWLHACELIRRAEAAAAALRAANSFTADDEMDFDLARGETLFSIGHNQEALESLGRAAHQARDSDQHRSLACALLLEGQVRIALGQYAEATSSLSEALTLFSDLDDSEGRTHATLRLASVKNALGHYEEAGELVDEALSFKPAPPLEALGLGTLGWSLALRGEFEEARSLLARAVAHHERTGDRRERSALLRRLHWIELSCGRYESAIATAVRAREDSIAIGDLRGEAKANLGIGQARIAQGLYEEGISFLDRTLEKLKHSGDAHCEAEALWLLGRARCETGALDDAEALLRRAITMVREIGDEDDEFRMLLDRSGLELARNRPADAATSATKAKEIARRLRNGEGVALAELQLATIELSSGDAAAATVSAEQAVEVLDRIGSSERWKAWSVLGKARRVVGDPDAARAALERSLSLVEDIRDQIPLSDSARRLEIAATRGEPARELGSLLVAEGLSEEADRLAAQWIR